MKKSLTRKLTIAVIALVFAVVSLSTSTYAWFTMSNDADVEAFTADVKAGQGIEIAITTDGNSANAQWYTGVVPQAVIQTVVPTGFMFDAVTTTNAVDFTKLSGAASENDYIKFFVHIKAAQDGKISLNGITFDSEVADPAGWTADAAYALDGTRNVVVNDKVLYEVENAARISITTTSGTVIYENTLSAPSGDKVADGVSSYVAGNQGGLNKQGNQNGAFSYYNAKNSTKLLIGNAPTQTTEYVEKLATDARLLSEVSAGGELKVEVKVWIEGWDTECLNAIFAQKLSTALSFVYSEN